MVWGHFCPLQAHIQGSRGPKMTIFGSKSGYYGRLVPGRGQKGKMTKNGHIMAILSHEDKTFGAETSTTLISIDTYDLVRIIALSGVWKYSYLTTPL